MLQRSCAINRDTHDAFLQKQVIFAAQGPLHAYFNQSETAGGQFRTSNMWTAHIWSWFLNLTEIRFRDGRELDVFTCSMIYFDAFGSQKTVKTFSHTLISFILTLFSHHIVLITKHVTSFFFGRIKKERYFLLSFCWL